MKKILFLAFVVFFVLSISGMSFAANEFYEGTVIKINVDKITIKSNKGEIMTVAGSLKDIKIGDKVTVNNGKVAKLENNPSIQHLYKDGEDGVNRTSLRYKDGTVGSTRPEAQKPVPIYDKNNPCYKSIINLQTQIGSLKETSNNFVSKRYTIRKVNQNDLPTLKTHFAEIQNVSVGLKSRTEQFQGGWRQWRRECVTTNTNKKILAEQLSSIRTDLAAIIEILGNRDKDDLGKLAGQQTDCGHCYNPWQERCDFYQCQQCCTTCPPDPFSTCAVSCKTDYLLCMMAGIIKDIDQTQMAIIRNMAN